MPSKIGQVQMQSFKDNIPLEALQFAKVARLEDRRSELCMSTMEIFTKGGPCQPVIKHHLSIFYIYLFIYLIFKVFVSV